MVPNPIYGADQVYDSIDPQSESLNKSPAQLMPRYSYSPSRDVESSLDTIQRTQETFQMTYSTCEGVSAPLSNVYSIPGEVVGSVGTQTRTRSDRKSIIKRPHTRNARQYNVLMNEYALITPDDLIINAMVYIGADSRARCTIVGLPTRHDMYSLISLTGVCYIYALPAG